MRIKLDENLPLSLVPVLALLGHDVDTVPGESLTGCDDKTVWAGTQQTRRLLITQDLDFSDTRVFVPGTHHGILLVRLREPGRDALRGRLTAVFQAENAETWSGCCVVVTEHKIRVVRPAQ